MKAVTIDRDLALSVLTIVRGEHENAGPIATHRMTRAFPLHDQRRPHRTVVHVTARTRLFLHKLREAGLVEGVEGRDGGIRWWKITDAGRDFLGRETDHDIG
jgi:hypothetical protein